MDINCDMALLWADRPQNTDHGARESSPCPLEILTPEECLAYFEISPKPGADPIKVSLGPPSELPEAILLSAGRMLFENDWDGIDDLLVNCSVDKLSPAMLITIWGLVRPIKPSLTHKWDFLERARTSLIKRLGYELAMGLMKRATVDYR